MMFFTKADKEDFEQVQKLYWNLIDKSQDEESFPGWKKGVYQSDDLIRQNIECGYMYVLKDDGIIRACAICNPYANEEYKQVPWKVNEGPVWIIHTLAVDYDSRGCGVGRDLVRNIIRFAGENGIKALHLDVISHNKAAETFYRKLGFTYVSTQTIFYGVVGSKKFKMFEYIIQEANMERVVKFLKEAETYYLATVEGDQPRVRPFGTAHVFEGRLYIQTGKSKDVSKQIHANPKVEICAFKDGEWLRLAGELVEDDRREARQSMLDAYPSLQNMYSADDGNTEVFYFKNAVATFSSFTHEPQIVKFN